MPLMPSPSTWSYVPPGTTVAGVPTWSDVDEVRFWIQDTNPAVRFLSDAEIQWLIDVWRPKYDTLLYPAAVALEQLATAFAGSVSVSADGVSVQVGDISARFADRAKRLRQLHKDSQVGGEVDITNLMWDNAPDFLIAPLQFGVGVDDNPEAGRQNYGSERGTYFPSGMAEGWY